MGIINRTDSVQSGQTRTGLIEVRFGNRRCFVGAMMMGDETLLGAIPMEDLDLAIHPLTQEITVNPESPNIPSSLAKQLFPK